MPYWFDGNNLIGLTAQRARTERETRKQFLAYLSSCAKMRGGRFLVYFDGDDPDRAVPPAGVRVRYSAPLSTDDAIIRDLAGCRAPAEVIVVTNDRSLASRSRDAGAKTLDWREFAAKASPRRGRGSRNVQPRRSRGRR